MTTTDPHTPPIIVLYGALRSGTTLFRLMLNAHPRITCRGERDFMVDYMTFDTGSPTLDREALAADRIFRTSGLTVPDTDDGHAAFRDMARQAGAGQPGQVVVLVMHRHLDRLLALCPDVRIIHLIRDPRDVARSSIGMGWAGNTWFGVDHWIGTEQAWDAHGSALPQTQVFPLHYEHLLEEPDDQLTRLCAFMGLTYDPVMLTFDQNSTYSALDPKLAYQWRQKQTPQEVAEVEHKVGPLLAARGYAPSGHPPTAPSLLRRMVLNWTNRHHKWRLRLKRYGYVDPIQEALARRLGLTSLQHAAQRRIDEKKRKRAK